MIDPQYNYTMRLYNVYAWVASWSGFDPQPLDNDYYGDVQLFQNTSFLAGEF